MELFGDEVNGGHFRVTHFTSDTVFSPIKPTDYGQSLNRSCFGDKLEYGLVIAQWFSSPVRREERAGRGAGRI